MSFTDYLDNPISVGDLIIYPTAQGSSSADMNLARVIEVDPLVKGQGESGRTDWHFASNLHKPPSKRPYSGERYPTRYFPTPDDSWHTEPDPAKAYRLIVKRIRDGQKSLQRTNSAYDDPDRLVYLKNVDRVTVVTGLVNFRAEDITHD